MGASGMKLEELRRGAQVQGVEPNQPVTVVDVQWHGTIAVELVYKRADGHAATKLLYRDDEPALNLVTGGRVWSFSGDGNRLRLASEAYRIRLAHLFDPVLAVHTSLIEPLPHQITAVYQEMLSRQPLRYVLADDPGAGKTVMAGLFVKELAIRGDVRRCLICVPGNLCEQWQDELWQKFQLPFDILTRDSFESSRTGNPFIEHDFVIVRLDQISRNDDLQAKLRVTDWDLIICDEAHKLSASFFGGELKETKRYKLGKLLGEITRHLLLITATPHNGKEEDFQLFLALLDPDRFEGRFRDGVHTVDVSDLMRRMVKESLRKFDGTPLFPERKAYTVDYALSDAEAELYEAVTEYVRQEFSRADQLESGGRKGTVGFALTILQRRLASSPEAIYRSLQRRRERLEARLRYEKQLKRDTRDRQPWLRPPKAGTVSHIVQAAPAPWSCVQSRMDPMRGAASGGVRTTQSAVPFFPTPNNTVQGKVNLLMNSHHTLSHQEAVRIVAAIQQELEQRGLGAAIAVVDAHGELLAFLRTNGCKLPSITIAINKAFTAARERRPTAEIGAESRQAPFPMTNFGDPRYTAWGGGVPIIYRGDVVGAVGVSGLTEDEDIALAQLGVESIV